MNVFLSFISLVSGVLITAPALAQNYANPLPSEPYCREYTQSLKIGNALQQGYGTACRQPDGSWQLMPTAQTAGAPPPPPITYVVRENNVYYQPPSPAFETVILGNFRHGEERGGYWHGHDGRDGRDWHGYDRHR